MLRRIGSVTVLGKPNAARSLARQDQHDEDDRFLSVALSKVLAPLRREPLQSDNDVGRFASDDRRVGPGMNAWCLSIHRLASLPRYQVGSQGISHRCSAAVYRWSLDTTDRTWLMLSRQSPLVRIRPLNKIVDANIDNPNTASNTPANFQLKHMAL